MANQCSHCGEHYPSHYYLVTGTSPAVCNRCVSALPQVERDKILEAGATAVGQTLRRCLHCGAVMMRGELAYRDRGPHDATRVREVSWVLARRESVFLGLLSDWVVDKALALDAWRCGGCGSVELASDPDPAGGEEHHVRAQRIDEESTLL